MKFVKQTLDLILQNVSSLDVDWKDDIAKRVIARIEGIPRKDDYEQRDVLELFSGDFDDGLLICRLFLGMSKDTFLVVLADALGPGGQGVKRYTNHRNQYVEA